MAGWEGQSMLKKVSLPNGDMCICVCTKTQESDPNQHTISHTHTHITEWLHLAQMHKTKQRSVLNACRYKRWASNRLESLSLIYAQTDALK